MVEQVVNVYLLEVDGGEGDCAYLHAKDCMTMEELFQECRQQNGDYNHYEDDRLLFSARVIGPFIFPRGCAYQDFFRAIKSAMYHYDFSIHRNVFLFEEKKEKEEKEETK